MALSLSLANASLGLEVSTTGGSIWRFFAKRDGAEIPVFRAPPTGAEVTPLKAGCFPLVPFGNRVRGNRFQFEANTYTLTPNTAWDRHYLHGDGWTGEWHVLRLQDDRLDLGFAHRGPGTPYRYECRQSFALDGPTLALTLTVTNTGAEALPFGLGWHPYFPLTPRATLRARTRAYWDEDASWLPTTQHPTEGDLDFAAGAPPPRRWVNTQFEGWDGRATLTWPERQMAIALEADPLFDRCLLFVSDPAFDPGYAYDFFCFEPMSHGADDHNKPGQGGLRRLAPGERLDGSVRFTVSPGLGDRAPA